MRPRLGVLGVGWIGLDRMRAVLADGRADVVGIADPQPACARAALELAPAARLAGSLDELLALRPDGVVIATPSALHAEQSLAALGAGCAVFCQKPLARTAAETARVVAAAREADRLLGIDLSYRHTAAMRRVRELVVGGELGDVYAADLVFHNAYGPDKPWFRDPARSGGGCLIDLGIHLVDLALWTLGHPALRDVDARLFARGRPLAERPGEVEDHALAHVGLAGGTVLRLACSWNLPAGCDAVIEATFWGTRAAAGLHNVGGSFYDLAAERFDGCRRTTLAEPPDDWGGRAAVDWVRRLADDRRFDPEVARAVDVAAVLDACYGR